MKLKRTETKTVNEKTVDFYEIASYTVKIVTHKDGWKNFIIRKGESENEYLPEIYCNDDFEGNIISFDIQTTSYGSLLPSEIEKLIQALTEAKTVANILTKEFIKED